MNYNYIIVEDNLGSLQNLQTAMKQHQNFKEAGVAHSVSKGISLALSAKPHIIFLDVELGDEKGFDLIKEIRQFTSEMPFIIMNTHYDKYAKKAVNSDVLYFLDKPVDPDELIIALHKFEKKYLEMQSHITIKNTEGHFFMQLEEIHHIQSDNNCCRIIKKDNTQMFVTKTLKEIETILPLPFIRIHKSYIVNTQYIHMLNTTKKFIQLKGISLQNEFIELPISDLYMEKVKQTLLVAKSN
ncbi:LytR/AlgR family response regulator transcription factor [Chryseobacterium shigense]|uniref:Two-component system LytT family response regulator n=1 Tax=Chryseobacterium shigense TaxID=297244 RepID=A0A841NN19_9FLAO|nr:LytTR family DNA-binding domain-containing protein [Chryseobacterium shigense]MBB6372619.1 two-component system LytT family response regulator [Chryseobacterium shigense]